jgi:uncharacterized protein YvpB
MDDIFRDEDLIRDVPEDVPALSDFGDKEVPSHVDVLPDGRETVVIGDPDGDKAFTHQQGENLLDFQMTCGLCSCENVLRSFGRDVTETDIVVFAAQRGLCNTDGMDGPNRGSCGGTTPDSIAEILTRQGFPASVFEGGSLEDLADNIEQGRGVIIGVNAGALWHDPNSDSGGRANHAITVTGVARDPMTGDIQGFFVNDSGNGQAAQFVDASLMREAWEEAGGTQVVTAEARPYTN